MYEFANFITKIRLELDSNPTIDVSKKTLVKKIKTQLEI